MLISRYLEKVAPRSVWKYRIHSWHFETGEPEQVLVPELCDRQKMSVDIGAADGAYTVRMFLYSASVLAFEARPDAARNLASLFHNTTDINIRNLALSDSSGTVQLRIPEDRPMLATIDTHNTLTDSPKLSSVSIACRRLDDYNLSKVGFVKIDVEGHEFPVLLGAQETIRRNRPNFLTEIEGRHNSESFNQIIKFFDSVDYEGFFYLQELRPLSEFDPAKHQAHENLVDRGKRVGTYINNFIFRPR